MLPSSTVENYLKAIYQAQLGLGDGQRFVPMGQLASTLGVVPGTATTMMKALADAGLVLYEPYTGVRLTPAGEKLAALVLRRHRLIELFLVEVMGMSWAEVHDEAEKLEHAVSDRLIERIDAMLGHPEVDPHGDPIPDPEGTLRQRQYHTLLDCPLNTPVVVARVTDQDADFLRFLENSELMPGRRIHIEERDTAADRVLIRDSQERPLAIGMRAASKLLVKVASLLIAFLLLGGTARTQPAAGDGDARDGRPELGATASECRLSGRVLDRTGLAVPGAAVLVEPSRLETTTDAAGQYCFGTLAPGNHRVSVSLEGFREIRRVDVALAGDGHSRDFILEPSFSQEVVVTATRTGKRLDDVPVRTEIVSRDLMERLSARTLADAIEFTNGVRVESNCQNCNFSQIRLLGLEGAYTQILIEGQPVISSLAQVYGIEHLPARMIERIEVVKGGGSAIYGPGSVGGVVNVIPREPARTGGAIETRYEWMDGLPNHSLNGAFDWVDANRRTFLTTYAQVDRVKPLDLSGDGFTEVSTRALDAFGTRFNRYLFESRVKLTAEFTHAAENRRGGDRLHLPEPMANVAESIRSRRDGGTLTWFHGYSHRFDYRLTASVAETHRDSYYGAGMDPNAFGATDSLLTVVDSQFNHYARNHVVSWGAQVTDESLHDEQPAYARFTRADHRNVGLFVQDDWTFARGWELLYGARVDAHSAVAGLVASPRLALMWSPRAELDVRASVARGFRAPQVFDEDLHLSTVGGEARIIRPNPALRRESSTNYMLGVEWKPMVGPGQALVEANLFHTELADLFNVQRADDPATPDIEFMRVNHGDARVYGVEVNLGWGIGDHFIAQGGILHQRARFGRAEPDFGSRDFFRTPRTTGMFSLTWASEALADVFLGIRYTGPMTAPHYAGYIPVSRLEITDAFLTVDASASRAVPLPGLEDARVVVALRNITNTYQPDLDQGPHRDSAYVYGPRFPRAVSAGLQVEF